MTLPLHQEQRLIFPEPVQVDVNGQLTTDQLRIINDHQTVYLTALTSFEKTTRIYVTLKQTGQIIFLDVSTSELEKQRCCGASSYSGQIAPRLRPDHSPFDAQSLSSFTEYRRTAVDLSDNAIFFFFRG